jgi:hypothetical protein
VGSNLTKDDAFLRVIKTCSMPSCGGEVKPSAPCHKILWHEKYFLGYALLRDVPAVRIARELWWMNQEFSPVNIFPP